MKEGGRVRELNDTEDRKKNLIAWHSGAIRLMLYQDEAELIKRRERPRSCRLPQANGNVR